MVLMVSLVLSFSSFLRKDPITLFVSPRHDSARAGSLSMYAMMINTTTTMPDTTMMMNSVSKKN